MGEQESSDYKKIFTFSRLSPGESVPLQVTKIPIPGGTAPQSDPATLSPNASGLKPPGQISSIAPPGPSRTPDVSPLANPVITLPQSGRRVDRTISSTPLPEALPSPPDAAPSLPGTDASPSGATPSLPGTDASPSGATPSLPGIAASSSGTAQPQSAPGTAQPKVVPSIPGTAQPKVVPSIPGTVQPKVAPSIPGTAQPQSAPGTAQPKAGASITPPGVALTVPSGSTFLSGASIMSQVTSAVSQASQGSASPPPPSLSGLPLINVTSKSIDSIENPGSGVPRAYVNAMREKVSYMLNFQMKVTSLTKHLSGLMRRTARSGEGNGQETTPGGQ